MIHAGDSIHNPVTGERLVFRQTSRETNGEAVVIETMFSLAADGKTNRKGMPNPLQLAVIANAHFDTVQLPFPPAIVHKLGLALGAPLGRLLGYGATYVPGEAASAVATASI